MAKIDIISTCCECSKLMQTENAHEKILFYYCETEKKEIEKEIVNQEKIPEWCPLEEVN